MIMYYLIRRSLVWLGSSTPYTACSSETYRPPGHLVVIAEAQADI